MPKHVNQFLFREKYEKWLLENGVKSLGAYYPQDKFDRIDTDLLFLDLIGIFAYQKEYLYVSALFEEWKSDIDKKYPKTSLNRYSYLYKYKQFIETQVYGKTRLNKSDKQRLETLKQYLPSVRETINKSQNPKVDGMDSLISFVNEEQFVKLAIESSYFFSPDLVAERFDEIRDYIYYSKEEDSAFKKYDCKYLPARYTQKEENDEDGAHIPNETKGKVYFYASDKSEPLCVIYQEGARGENKECNGQICGGGNGNARVCQLIKSRTGYDLGATADKKHFRNFIISHIWGHAIDPRYFTNLWNIVIVPAWANHLLDKEEEGTLASTFKATIKKVITQLYELQKNHKYDWDSIKLVAPNYKDNEVLDKYKIYQINIIERLIDENNKSFGNISKQIVSI